MAAGARPGHAMGPALEWANMTDPQIAAARDAGVLVAVPVGAIEQHGPHLPVDADILSASAVTLEAARRVRKVPVLVAPGLPFGFSPHHASKPATLSLGLSTYLAVLRELIGGIAASGFQRIVLVNGHGGNTAPLKALVGELVMEGIGVAAIDYFQPGEPVWRDMLQGQLKRVGHACEFETSLTAWLRPAQRAAIEAASTRLSPRLVRPWVPSGEAADPFTADGASWAVLFQGNDCGYFGDPAAGTAAAGERLMEVLADGLAHFFDAFATTPVRVGVARGPAGERLLPPITPVNNRGDY